MPLDFNALKGLIARHYNETGHDKMLQQLLNQLRQLKLSGMASALQTQMEQPGTYEGLAFAERLQCLVDHEDLERNPRLSHKKIIDIM